MGDEDIIAYIKNLSVDIDNNCHLFWYSIDYAGVKFLQASKISKRFMDMFYNNHYLAPMQK